MYRNWLRLQTWNQVCISSSKETEPQSLVEGGWREGRRGGGGCVICVQKLRKVNHINCYYHDSPTPWETCILILDYTLDLMYKVVAYHVPVPRSTFRNGFLTFLGRVARIEMVFLRNWVGWHVLEWLTDVHGWIGTCRKGNAKYLGQVAPIWMVMLRTWVERHVLEWLGVADLVIRWPPQLNVHFFRHTNATVSILWCFEHDSNLQGKKYMYMLKGAMSSNPNPIRQMSIHSTSWWSGTNALGSLSRWYNLLWNSCVNTNFFSWFRMTTPYKRALAI